MPQPRWTTADLLDLEFLLQQDEGEDMALLSGALYRNFGPSFVFYYFLFVAALLVVIFIDLHHQIIPDKISLPGIVIGGGILYAVAAGYVLLTGKEGMGGGDIKLLAMIRAFLGWQSLLYVVFASSLTGSVIGGLSLLLLRIQLASATFFGYPKSINCMAFQLAIYFLYYFLIISDRVKLWHSCNCLFLQPKKVALGT